MPSAFTKRITRRVRSSPTTNLLAKKEKTPPYTKPNPSGLPTRATSSPTREAFKPSSGSSSAKPRKDHSEVDCWTSGKKEHYSGDCPSNTKRKSLLSKNKPFRSLLAKQAFESWILTISPSVTIAWCMVAEGIIVMQTTEKFMKPFQMSWLCLMKIRTYSRVCSTLRQTLRLQPS
jgi:hypothetical protein